MSLTRNVLLPNPLDQVNVEDGAQHALQDADLRADAQRQQHEEEDDGPERRYGELYDGLREHDEGQARALGRLVQLRLHGALLEA